MRKRFPHLHRRGAIFYCFLRVKNGKRREKSLRTGDINVALKRYEQLMNEIRTGHAPNDQSDWTLQEAGAHWLVHRLHRVSTGALRSERSHIRNLQRGLGENARLQTIADIEHIRRYQNCRLQAGISSKSINNELQTLAGILRLAKLWQRIEADYQPLRVRKSDVPDALTRQESGRLLRVAAESAPEAVAPYAAVLAFDTGLRSAEIKGLRLGDLHHEEACPYICVRRSITKTDAGARRVALGKIAIWALRKLISRARLLGAVSAEDHLLPTDRSRHTRSSDPLHGVSGYDPGHHQSSWESEWRQFRQAVGISHRRFHDLRHSYTTRAAEAGVPAAVIQAQVGHLSEKMVRWYTHVSEQAQFKATRQIEDSSLELIDALGLQRSREVF